MLQISTNKLNLWKFVKFVGEKNKKFRERYLYCETSITNMRFYVFCLSGSGWAGESGVVEQGKGAACESCGRD